MFRRLVVDSLSDQEDKEALLEGEHMRKENYGLLIGVTWVLFGVPFWILDSVWQVTWSMVNRYIK